MLLSNLGREEVGKTSVCGPHPSIIEESNRIQAGRENGSQTKEEGSLEEVLQ